jgi:hypothetical protein
MNNNDLKELRSRVGSEVTQLAFCKTKSKTSGGDYREFDAIRVVSRGGKKFEILLPLKFHQITQEHLEKIYQTITENVSQERI